MTEYEASSSREDARKRWWYLWDVLSLAGAVLVGPYSIRVIDYIAGLRNDMGLRFQYGFPVVCGLWPLLAIGVALLVVHMICLWPKHIADRKRLRLLRMGATGLLVVLIILPFTPLRIPGPSGFYAGFRRHVLRTVDIPAVQAWLGTLSPDVCMMGLVSIRPNGKPADWPASRDWPATLTHVNPQFIVFGQADANRVTIRLMWGIVDESWGVEIGPEDMPTPETYGQVSWDENECRLRLASGAYVWHRIE
ncbi:MAG: hypothetical protein KBE65_22940 [Phycisphaerae bacterium]|nr:hypothetical protein [Phycisphaerae bacterium]